MSLRTERETPLLDVYVHCLYTAYGALQLCCYLDVAIANFNARAQSKRQSLEAWKGRDLPSISSTGSVHRRQPPPYDAPLQSLCKKGRLRIMLIHGSIRKAVRVGITAAFAMLILTGVGRNVVFASPHNTSPKKAHSTLPDGWYTLSGSALHPNLNQSNPNVIVGNGGGNCPNGTYSYSNEAWDCLDRVYDNTGHRVWIRIGQSGNSGFGYNHFYFDHNLDLSAAEFVLETNYGIYQSSTGRYVYEDFYEKNGQVSQWVRLFEQRTVGEKSPDNYPLGIVTGYCTDGNFVQESQCPPWVNEEL